MSHFCPLPTIAQKMKILKKWRNPLEISSFYTSAPKVMIICYTVPKIWCGRDVTIFHFRLFFPLLPKKLLDMAWAIFCPVTLAPTPKQPKKSKLKNKTKKKKRKNKDKECLEISWFYTFLPKIMIRWCTVSEIWCMTDEQTDGLMDGQKKWNIGLGAQPKNILVDIVR